jgi:hypothetical protein
MAARVWPPGATALEVMVRIESDPVSGEYGPLAAYLHERREWMQPVSGVEHRWGCGDRHLQHLPLGLAQVGCSEQTPECEGQPFGRLVIMDFDPECAW